MSEVMPAEVARSLRFFISAGIWHRVSRNACAAGCRDAASKRSRLGRVGIPLSDELKSWVGRGPQADQFVALHCRGHESLDLAKVATLVGHPVERVDSAELSARFGQSYGLVTPFGLAEYSDVKQLFDYQVTHEYFPPDTMMTNLGHCEWGVEFDPRELVDSIKNAEVADITVEKSGREPVEHVIGILTGNGPESGMLLWERINERVRLTGPTRSGGDTAFPRIIIESVPEMGLSMEMADREAAVREVVLGGVKRLCTNGATLVSVACNTTQFFSADISLVCEASGAEFVSIVDETRRVLVADSVKRVALVAIGLATDLDHYSDFRRLNDDVILELPVERNARRIEQVAYDVKIDPDSAQSVNGFRDVIRFTKAETILLALTELSVVHGRQTRRQRQRPGKTLYDTLDILANALADRYVAERLVVEEDREVDE